MTEQPLDWSIRHALEGKSRQIKHWLLKLLVDWALTFQIQPQDHS